jgi:hypothetical protein
MVVLGEWEDDEVACHLGMYGLLFAPTKPRLGLELYSQAANANLPLYFR